MITEACKMHIHIQIVDYSIRCKSRVQNTANNEMMHTTKYMCVYFSELTFNLKQFTQKKTEECEKVINL